MKNRGKNIRAKLCCKKQPLNAIDVYLAKIYHSCKEKKGSLIDFKNQWFEEFKKERDFILKKEENNDKRTE